MIRRIRLHDHQTKMIHVKLPFYSPKPRNGAPCPKCKEKQWWPGCERCHRGWEMRSMDSTYFRDQLKKTPETGICKDDEKTSPRAPPKPKTMSLLRTRSIHPKNSKRHCDLPERRRVETPPPCRGKPA